MVLSSSPTNPTLGNLFLAHPDWIHMERQATPNHTLDYLLWCPSKLRPPILAPTLSHSFTLWDSLREHSQLTSPIKPLSHIFHNPHFPPGIDIRVFKWWLDKGLYRIDHFFLPSDPLSKAYCISKTRNA